MKTNPRFTETRIITVYARKRRPGDRGYIKAQLLDLFSLISFGDLLTCCKCNVCGFDPLPPLLALDSLDNIDTVSLNAESLSGDSVRPESFFNIKSFSDVSSFSLGVSDEERVCVRDWCCANF